MTLLDWRPRDAAPTADGADRAGGLAANPLRSRADLQRAVLALCEPLEARRSPGGARIRLAGPSATYGASAQDMEGFARVLWGVAPLVAGGGAYRWLDRIVEGLGRGCDPDDSEYWGRPSDRDQRLVECAAIAAALLVARDRFWDVLSRPARAHVARYLATINEREVHENNWRFFRVVVNLALAHCDAPFSRGQIPADLDRLDACYLGAGWYFDGNNEAVDYYAAFGMHFYGLLAARALRPIDPRRAAVLTDRAAAFAHGFADWFAPDGAALPYGRSLTYRCAAGAFWGALAWAGVEGLPWGAIKGLALRHLRWWLQRPLVSDDGLLTIGYGYANQLVGDRYSSPASPYWALKAGLPVALAEGAPFWQAEEAPLPVSATPIVQASSALILCRDRDHLFALAGAERVPPRVRHGSAKYGKFCYSTRFGFSLPAASRLLTAGAHDSALALSERGDDEYRGRERSERVETSADRIVSHWRPWPDVSITSWLVPLSSWHVRVHHIRTGRALTSAEGGFALALARDDSTWQESPVDGATNGAALRTAHGVSALVDLCGRRRATAIRADPNTNVLWSRTVIPTLIADLDVGEHWLACAVGAIAATDGPERLTSVPCELEVASDAFILRDNTGRIVLHERTGDRCPTSLAAVATDDVSSSAGRPDS